MKSFRNKQARPKKNKLILGPRTVLQALEQGESLDTRQNGDLQRRDRERVLDIDRPRDADIAGSRRHGDRRREGLRSFNLSDDSAQLDSVDGRQADRPA